MERLVSSTAWDQHLLFFVTQTVSFFVVIFFFLLFQHFLGRFVSNPRNPSNPAGHCTDVLTSEDFGKHDRKPWAFVCNTHCMCVRVCVITYAWLWEGVKLDSKILYNTAYICHGRELPHELNRDKEQIYLKWLCYIPWKTVKLKKNQSRKWT